MPFSEVFFATGIVADFQSLRHQETVRSDAHAGVVVKAPPTPPLIVAQPQVLLEILVITLDAPAHVRGAHQIAQIRGLWQRGQVVLFGFGLVCGPLDEQPLLGQKTGLADIAHSAAHPHRSEAARQGLIRTFAPADVLEYAIGQ